MNLLLLACLVLGQDVPGMEALVEKLGADAVVEREGAEDSILTRWEVWTAADLVKLAEAGRSSDAETGTRARALLGRIEVRRELGKAALERFPDADKTGALGTPAGRSKLLAEAGRRAYETPSAMEHARRLVQAARKGRWELDPDLFRALQASGAPPIYGDLLLPYLESPRADLRLWALQYLTTAEHAARVVPLVRDTDPAVRRQAVATLGTMKATGHAEAVRACLGEPDPNLRSTALSTLAAFGGPKDVEAIAGAVRDSTPWVRQRAILALRILRAVDRLPDVVAALRDAEEAVRVEAILATAALGGKKSAEDLVRLLDDPAQVVRVEALNSLGSLGVEGREEEITRRLSHKDFKTRLAAASCLAQLRAERRMDEVAALLRDPVPEVRGGLAFALAAYRHDSRAFQVAALLQDPSEVVRCAAIGALGAMNVPSFQPRLIPLLKDDDESVRSSAAEAIVKLTRREDVPALARLVVEAKAVEGRYLARGLAGVVGDDGFEGLLSSEDVEVRKRTAAALACPRPEDQVRELLPLLGHAEEEVRVFAIRVLGRSGVVTVGASIVPFLAQEGDLREEAIEAIAALGARGQAGALAALAGEARCGERVIEALVQMGAREQAGALVKALPKALPHARERIMKGLVELGTPGDEDLIGSFLKGEDRDLQQTSLFLTGHFRLRRHLPAVVALVKDEAVNVRSAAIRVLGFLGGRKEGDILITAFRKAEYRGDQEAAAGALGRIGEGAGVLAEALGKERDIRHAWPMARALAWMDAREQTGALVRALKEADDDREVPVLWLLGRLDAGREAVPYLKSKDAQIRAAAVAASGIDAASFLDDEDPKVRLAAVLALERKGAADRCVEIVARLGDPDDEVRLAAAAVLAVLDGKSRVEERTWSEGIRALRKVDESSWSLVALCLLGEDEGEWIRLLLEAPDPETDGVGYPKFSWVFFDALLRRYEPAAWKALRRRVTLDRPVLEFEDLRQSARTLLDLDLEVAIGSRAEGRTPAGFVTSIGAEIELRLDPDRVWGTFERGLNRAGVVGEGKRVRIVTRAEAGRYWLERVKAAEPQDTPLMADGLTPGLGHQGVTKGPGDSWIVTHDAQVYRYPSGDFRALQVELVRNTGVFLHPDFASTKFNHLGAPEVHEGKVYTFAKAGHNPPVRLVWFDGITLEHGGFHDLTMPKAPDGREVVVVGGPRISGDTFIAAVDTIPAGAAEMKVLAKFRFPSGDFLEWVPLRGRGYLQAQGIDRDAEGNVTVAETFRGVRQYSASGEDRGTLFRHPSGGVHEGFHYDAARRELTIAITREGKYTVTQAKGEGLRAAPGDSAIRAPAGGSEIVIRTTERLAGAIHSLTWNGKEFIDSTDHGRQLQSASNFDAGGPFVPETFNPTEAGSMSDGAGPLSTSVLLSLRAEGRTLEARTQMAFWLRPGEKSAGHPSRSAKVLSNHLLARKVSLGIPGLPHVIEYSTTFTVPAGEKHAFGQFEALTGYMPPEFSRFWCFDADAGELRPLTDGPGEQARPVILATESGSHAMGVLSADPPPAGFKGPGYGRWRFAAEKVVKWNSVFRTKDPVAGDYAFRHYVVVGSLADVTASLKALTRK